MSKRQTKQQTMVIIMRLMTNILMATLFVACGDKEADDTAAEEVVEDSAAEEAEEVEEETEEGSEGEGEESEEEESEEEESEESEESEEEGEE